MALRADIQDLRQSQTDLLSKLQRAEDQLTAIHNQTTIKPVIAGMPEPKKPKKTAALFDNLPALSFQGIPTTFNNGLASMQAVAFTFDGGSLANVADIILDTLASRNVKATMFLTGEFLRKFPEVTRRIVSMGHEVGNHTLNHLHFTTYETDRTQTTLSNVNSILLRNQLEHADRLFLNITGQNMAPLWRAPYGEFNSEICRWGISSGYLHVGWRQGRSWRNTLDSFDWIPSEETPGYKRPHEVLEKYLAIADSDPTGLHGGIILMHLGSLRKKHEDQVFTILGILIDNLRNRGYRLLTVSELAQGSGIDLNKLPPRYVSQVTSVPIEAPAE